MRAFLLALAAATPYTEDSHRIAFEEFKKEFSKKYETAEEEAQRYAAFKENRIYIKMFNEQNADIELGINEFADLTFEEFSATYIGGYKPEPAEQWSGLAYLGTDEYSGADLPSSVDWTTRGAVTPVKKQGCQDCWSFSATGALEGAWEIATGKRVSLSEQQLVDCTGSGDGCNGGRMNDAFGYAEQHGMCTEQSYSYKARGGQCHASGCTVGVPKGRVTGYRGVSQSENALMEAVAKGPVSVGIEADKGVFQHYAGGTVLSSPQCGTNLDHGVLVVGYGELNGKKYWKVKNSWGSSWGMHGYVLLARGLGGGGECGVLKDPSYPVVERGAELII